MGSEDLEAERLFDYGLLAPVETGNYGDLQLSCSTSSSFSGPLGHICTVWNQWLR